MWPLAYRLLYHPLQRQNLYPPSAAHFVSRRWKGQAQDDCQSLALLRRRKKQGKKQIVIGLLTDAEGVPVAVRVFEGNTSDGKTVADQVQTLAHRLGVNEVTLLGDRGMLKGPQIEQLPDGFRYLTAITKPQIRKMLDGSVLQYELFDERVCEVSHEGIRYLLRRNPARAEQIQRNREAKLATVERVRLMQTQYLAEHKRASEELALKKLEARIRSLKAEPYCKAAAKERVLSVQLDPEALREVALLDGCYVLKTDVAPDQMHAVEIGACRQHNHAPLILATPRFPRRTAHSFHLVMIPPRID